MAVATAWGGASPCHARLRIDQLMRFHPGLKPVLFMGGGSSAMM